jgi:HipA-like kinase
MSNPTGHIYAVQHVRKMRGGAQAHLLRASDNHFYVTKFQNNPQAVRILANEYLASKLGRALGLPMPEVRIIEVSEWLSENSPDLKIDLGVGPVPCASGLQLGSRYAADPPDTAVFDYLPEAMLSQVANWQDFPRVLAFDKWTGNSDGRQAVFVKQPKERFYSAVFIDQGYCFNAGEWDFPDLSLRGVYARNSVYERVTGWEVFEPTLSRIEQVDQAEIWNIAQEIPQQWHEHNTEALSRLIESLNHRRSSVRDLITSFRNSTRNPFPNWTAEDSRPHQSKPTQMKEE